MNTTRPEIMAPAGDSQAFLAALAAGADAVYLGLKHYSARMQAENFSISELSRLANLARAKDAKVYVAMNTLLKPDDLESAGRLIDRLQRQVAPQALIVQDLGFVSLARQAGFTGELHVSTLANASHPKALAVAASLGVKRVVTPRELNVDEIRLMAEACPPGLDLETFVHGALCHCVSGRCWWSSFLGGRSGLRGRCVQPCRRNYRQGGPKAQPQRLFSCLDLSLDVLVRPLLDIPQVKAWKIEGRKKGPHYVFYTVKAYRLLRDEGGNPEARKAALSLLEQSLGRPGSHSVFLPQRPHMPVDPAQDTGSGLLVGALKKELARTGKRTASRFYFQTREELLPGDLLRLGYEDEPWHRTIKVRARVPKRGRLDIQPDREKPAPVSGAKVFLVDRREPGLVQAIQALEKEAASLPAAAEPAASLFVPRLPGAAVKARRASVTLARTLPRGKLQGDHALWLEAKIAHEIPPPLARRIQWWLPPVIWPDEEKRWQGILDNITRKGGRHFVCNAPWQAGLLKGRDAELTAGPFCNIANALALENLRGLGFSSAIVSPELAGEDFLALPRQSPLPLGIVIRGLWPVGISRILAQAVRLDEPLQSPKRETFFVSRHGENYWIFPDRELDLTPHGHELERAGYGLFVTIREPWPRGMERCDRTSSFNWDLKLL